jgi:spore germination protein KB
VNLTKTENLLPIFNLPIQKYLLGTHIVTMLPFCETFVFMMMLPDMQKPKEFGKAFTGGFLIGAATLLFVVLRDTLVLGPYTMIASMPSFSVIRLINVGDILTRLDIIYAVVLILLDFYKISILYYATVLGFSKLIKLESYQVLIIIFGVLIIVYNNSVFSSSFEHMTWFAAAPTYSTCFLFILPASTLLVSAIRGKYKAVLSNAT